MSDLVAIVGAVAIITLMSIAVMSENRRDEVAAKAGLQQCVVDNKKVWQKECK